MMWQMLRSGARAAGKASTAFAVDEILGLDLANARSRLNDAWLYQGVKPEMEMKANELAARREGLRKAGKYEEADAIRREILGLGFAVEDTPQGPRVRRTMPAEPGSRKE